MCQSSAEVETTELTGGKLNPKKSASFGTGKDPKLTIGNELLPFRTEITSVGAPLSARKGRA